ncbi:hypothetical protein LR48_Vigan02g062800 [Vigna angularis]|uniref:Uncharacterized protein n=1 Tax=Phaseolus angularis TaxID=3914 RepID=A0A0L9TV79_PHAAN|nr:hypothetical protein LR48_Vigan02g062800 [Vigna angularis]
MPSRTCARPHLNASSHSTAQASQLAPLANSPSFLDADYQPPVLVQPLALALAQPPRRRRMAHRSRSTRVLKGDWAAAASRDYSSPLQDASPAPLRCSSTPPLQDTSPAPLRASPPLSTPATIAPPLRFRHRPPSRFPSAFNADHHRVLSLHRGCQVGEEKRDCALSVSMKVR